MSDYSNKTLLDKLFDGDIMVSEMFNPYNNGRFTKELSAMAEDEQAFRETLPEESRKGFDEAMTRHDEAAALIYAELFAVGFALGAKLIIEVTHPPKQTPGA